MIAFVDTETTSLRADTGEIWEVGLITPDGLEFTWMLPVTLEHADPISLAVGGFHERHWQGNNSTGRVFDPSREMYDPALHEGAPMTLSRPKFAAEFAALTHGCHLAGAVISFDEERLRRLLWAEGRSPSWHYHLVDVEALAAGFIAGKQDTEPGWGHHQDPARPVTGVPPWDSGDLSRAVGVDPADFDRHTALGDCRWAAAIYAAVLGKETR